MPEKMERFTQRARRVLSLAQEVAESFKHNYIGTEHLLLGMMREEGGIAGRVLREMGLEVKQVERRVLELTHAKTRLPNTPLALAPGTQRVLELAVDEARRMGHHYIGTEHILLGLVRQSEGVAIDVLKALGVIPEVVRRNTRRMIQESPVQGPTPVQLPSPSVFSPLPPTQLFPRATTFTQTQAYAVIQATITRILDMVAAQKITTEQAAELFNALQPYLSPTTVEKARLIAQVFEQVNLEKRQMHIIIRSSKTHDSLVEFTLPMQDMLNNLDTMVNSAITNQSGWFWAQDMGDNQIEFHIEDKES